MWRELIAEFKQAKKLRHYMLAVAFISLMLPLPAVFLFFTGESIETMKAVAMWSQVFMLIVLCVVSFVQANTQGIRDKRTVVSTKVYPLKGLVLGLFQQVPFWLITAILFALRDLIFPLDKPWSELFRNIAINVATLQYSGIMMALNYNWLSYFLSFCLLPIICELGYLLAYFWKIDIDDKLGGIHKK